YWFSVEPQRTAEVGTTKLPRLDLGEDSWDRLFTSRPLAPRLEEILPAYVRQRRWFGGKARRITSVAVADTIPVGPASGGSDAEPIAFWTLLRVEYTEGDPETYAAPMAMASPARGKE